jgi:hypothetical protein
VLFLWLAQSSFSVLMTFTDEVVINNMTLASAVNSAKLSTITLYRCSSVVMDNVTMNNALMQLRIDNSQSVSLKRVSVSGSAGSVDAGVLNAKVLEILHWSVTAMGEVVVGIVNGTTVSRLIPETRSCDFNLSIVCC